ncbi:primosomal protein N' [Clostridium algidicarnis]|uniref:Replication restart protein PriA n=2 Tax=Clostridium algidicarnis TaxID=37659 RepID=A0A2S6G172_9CLOT|nr:primosomal protein N' [Clostridium algidicarnis]MBU3218729.1 primosomal protein N' [Clostridium algidicarnis]MCB2285582.1 primosomal protein N' [Clostridium algidicarnis]PPK49667.1 replication restart DNA helicase PriA [Clostridium algidicarnis DSM 15099]
MLKFAGIVINQDANELDRIFTYTIKAEDANNINIGYRVKVPFGRGDRLVDGFVLYVYDESHEFKDSNIKMKSIEKIYKEVELFNEKDVNLMEFMRKRYLCSYVDALKQFLPKGIVGGMKNKTIEVLFTKEILEGRYKKEPYESIWNKVKELNGNVTRAELSKNYSMSLSSINTLIKQGFIFSEPKTVQRYNVREFEHYGKKIPNAEQKYVIDKILNSDKKVFLIHGVTGSGKTEVYMNLVEDCIKEGKSSIILVPEIALTPQMIERFKGRFGKDVAVFHSKLSDGERFDEWFRVKEGKAKLAVGARSAIFLPFKDLGIIIIDEEHETSYKSDSNPKYDAREIAEYRSKLEGCRVVLGTATPSIESYYKAEVGEIELLNMEKRIDDAFMPVIQVIDMREELENNNKSIFSNLLYSSMKDALEKKEQIILFLNRRGFSTFVSCRKCGYVFKCDKCDISMTYHFSGNYLSCHYCGKKSRATNVCPVCNSKYVKYFGVGTEKVETEVKKYFKEAKILRMDLDTTRRKDSYEKIYNSFKKGEADILIGTQMVAKGLDFPNVSLVGVLAADLSLNLPDYRASERTFQLITQVSGRAGRGKTIGNVVVQSYLPDSYSIKAAKEYNYSSFYKEELSIRKSMNYPPFAEILLINMSSKNEELLIKCIQDISINLKNKLQYNDKIVILGPCPCMISKIKELYRWQIIIKGEINDQLAKEIKDFLYASTKSYYKDIRLSIDINPSSLI